MRNLDGLLAALSAAAADVAADGGEASQGGAQAGAQPVVWARQLLEVLDGAGATLARPAPLDDELIAALSSGAVGEHVQFVGAERFGLATRAWRGS